MIVKVENKLNIPKCYTILIPEIDTSEDIKILRNIHNNLKENGFCYVKILKGDYTGSIAKFYPSDYELKDEDVVNHRTRSSTNRNVKCYWSGKLKWEKRKNNPNFDMSYDTAIILVDYQGETEYLRLDLKAGKETLLQQTKLYDINGKEIKIGDNVLYLNLRYGSGGSLCYGVVKGFNAHVRAGFVSVIISNKDKPEEESDLNYPSQQVCII